MKKWLVIVGLLLTFLLGVIVARWYFEIPDVKSTENATVLLEKIKAVTKLITVEGYLSEIYDYQDYYGYDLPGFRKKALLRIKAKVSVGYDLEGMKITSFPERKTIEISELTFPELLSLEHELDYYDIQEGVFNNFSTDDYNKLNANAKDYIRQKAQESELFDRARLQRNNVFEMIQLLVEGAGWQLVILETEGMLTPDTLQQ